MSISVTLIRQTVKERIDKKQTCADNWFWYPGTLNPTGSTMEKINSKFWLHGKFLSQREDEWPVKPCASLLTNSAPTATINRAAAIPINPQTELIKGLLEHNWSFYKVINSLCIIQKGCRNYKQSFSQLLPWSKVRNAISSSIISCFTPQAEAFIAKNELKHLVIKPQDDI